MPNEHVSESHPLKEIHNKPCGHILSKKRTEQNISIETIAHHLKLSKTQIEALENDSYPNKTLTAFHRGYLKKYCRIIGLEPQQLLNNLKAQGFQIHQPEFYYQSDSVKVKKKFIVLPLLVAVFFFLSQFHTSSVGQLVINDLNQIRSVTPSSFIVKKTKEELSTTNSQRPKDIKELLHKKVLKHAERPKNSAHNNRSSWSAKQRNNVFDEELTDE